MEFTSAHIKDVILVTPDVYKDKRGLFLETYRENLFAESGIDIRFVQDNLSLSSQNAIRGLHYQVRNQQAKLVMVPEGKILDVAVDLRQGSPTFGKHTSVILSSENRNLLFIPAGFAHGFGVLSKKALVVYKCSEYYDRDSERGLSWNDPELGIDWQITDPVVSEKDRKQPLLKEIPSQDLFNYPL